jgi:hypothetical protein
VLGGSAAAAGFIGAAGSEGGVEMEAAAAFKDGGEKLTRR